MKRIIVALANSRVVKRQIEKTLEGVTCSTPANTQEFLDKLLYTDEHLLLIVGHTGGVEIAQKVEKLRTRKGRHSTNVGSKHLEVHYFSTVPLNPTHTSLFASQIPRSCVNDYESLITFLKEQTGQSHEYVKQFVEEHANELQMAA